MNALHLIKTPVGATWAFRLIEQTQRLGVGNVVFMPVGDGRMADAYHAIGVPVVPAPVLAGPADAARWIGALRRRLSDRPPDLVHSHFFVTTMAARVAMRGIRIPRLFQIPGPLHLEHRPTRWWDRFSGGPDDFYIATCRHTGRLLVERTGVPPDRVFLSYYGTDVGAFGRPQGKLRELVGAGDRRIVGMVAWMYPPKRYLGHRLGIKGHEVFLDALPAVFAGFPDCVATIIGGAWGNGASYAGRLKARAASRPGGRVIFLGPRDDVPDLYPDLDVAVHPSLSENVGGAVESLLSGVPTVASAVGGLPDVVRDGETGYLVPPGDPAQLADRILRVLRHPEEARRMAARGRAAVLETFDVRRTAREVVAVYETIVRRAAGPPRHAGSGR